MNIKLILIGKTTKTYFVSALEEYTKRIKRHINFQIIVINDVKKKLPAEQLKKIEGELILKTVNQDGFYLLDDKGKEYSSEKFATFIENKMIQSTKNLTFVIGGAYGFSKDVYNKANGKISLSRLTFSHQIVRIIFAEQLYRALSIIKGDPYHHA